MSLITLRVTSFSLCFVVLCSQGVFAAPSPLESEGNRSARTINQRIVPRWIDETHFTFLEELPSGERVERQVDCQTGEITAVDNQSAGPRQTLSGGPLPTSETSATDTELTFVNESDEKVELFWLDMRGVPTGYGTLEPGESKSQHTFSGHAWMVRSAGRGEGRRFYGSLIAASRPLVAKIKQTFEVPENLNRRPRRFGNRFGDAASHSKDESKRFAIETTEQEQGGTTSVLKVWSVDEGRDSAKDLTRVDGSELVNFAWSPDSRFLAGWQLIRHQPEKVTMVESSPRGGGRAVVHEHSYRLPGDPYDEFLLHVFNVEDGTQVACEVPTVDFGRPQIRWLGDNQIVFEKVDRGHQRFRVFVVDPAAASVRTAVDESTDTFIWTMHGPNVPLVTYLNKTDEFVYSSEASGYRHLYLVDLNDAENSFAVTAERTEQELDQIKNLAITNGDWLVRKIAEVDEEARTIDLVVGSFYEDQDPYLQHLVRASLDGDMLVALTEAHGDHTYEFSPNGDYLIVSSSRVDSPPLHQLRRVSDGKLICDLVQAQRIDETSDWSLPQRFSAKGRDGETDIWGNVYFPADFDPSKKNYYPIIEAIYAGPHDSHVPTRYLHSSRHQDLTSLGFVVVQIDGMGTANRSKAFHDVCWHNLKDAGFPDRIAWIKAAADRFPAMDTSRVGIFGTSAGGQNACGAVLFHNDFYKSAYASCGCHDNRMDKSSWNEQWMGYPVEQHYSESSNIDNAHRLDANLFLVVGELDTNVPPESTYRLVDALIKADKDFEFLMVPSMGHSDGGRYGKRRMRDFFVRTLQPSTE
ncbi:prolyl oligopeptidase family serine peptidase [Stieleria sp. JC731]|uniref:prolyl oligopeptidase family serine peptidase n=1 Tax=Pirellulaceae TaxID=2691357 RepID=UPI001E32BA5E|nr:prolyl oligopeptidase family serine peptidase [Stieleria sp. JC731]MCC9602151.1 prolyl oligopeptidase family serine peptidase [Stieleria sp. JC731]